MSRKTKRYYKLIDSIVNDKNDGMPINDICEKHLVGQATVYKWIRMYNEERLGKSKDDEESATYEVTARNVLADLAISSAINYIENALFNCANHCVAEELRRALARLNQAKKHSGENLYQLLNKKGFEHETRHI